MEYRQSFGKTLTLLMKEEAFKEIQKRARMMTKSEMIFKKRKRNDIGNYRQYHYYVVIAKY